MTSKSASPIASTSTSPWKSARRNSRSPSPATNFRCSNTETPPSGTVVDAKRVADLPLSYGNPFLLIGLTAGVTFNGSVRLDRPFEPTHIVNFSMGGTRGNLNDITIDGAPTTATANANEVTASYVPPTDIVQEFKVQTNTFDAQFGQTQGGVTNISIKTGTNAFHGSAGYSFQRPSFWANDFFLNKAGTPRPDFRFDRWGGSFSGPGPHSEGLQRQEQDLLPVRLRGHPRFAPAPRRHHQHRPDSGHAQRRFLRAARQAGASYTIYDPSTRACRRRRTFPGDRFPGQQDSVQPLR